MTKRYINFAMLRETSGRKAHLYHGRVEMHAFNSSVLQVLKMAFSETVDCGSIFPSSIILSECCCVRFNEINRKKAI